MAIKERSREESELVNRIIHACWPYAELFRINTGSVKTATGCGGIHRGKGCAKQTDGEADCVYRKGESGRMYCRDLLL